ncbi:retinitis pigmentosa 1-like 1 protein, partial [Oncorhynchus keta]|uniref:retinitis pigmentosa 1-like 1 protein n=1 Tax=Oncorhynchus keta TaxID=8018 RepID=UPI00227A01DA
MQSAPAGLWDPHGPQSKDVSSLPVHTPSASRLSHLIAAPPTKRITFYKSGDTKFAGVRMAVHKRSFKCFDALLDDLSQKVPLPFGVRTVTTPRGIHSIKHLEQLEDGGCYLCSDRRQAKPINIELAGKRPALWHHNSRRVPQRPAEDPPPPSAPSHTPTRQRRILLVRNSDPAVRRSVILSRRSARSLRVFLEGISEIMQCHVRKLYTLEGRKIDSAQSLMTCPGVLVCVGREPFRPLLLNYVAKHSEEKLPGLGTRSPGNGARSPGTGARSPGTGARSPRNGQGARSRSSVCSEGHGSKKNVNFGLETKKTIIHPLSDSSNLSTRFSLSSDKSYPNGLSSQGGKEAVLNDDIEKRVLVNKDGSLSVEMRVRFRLHNDERLQWSTEIKKSPSDSLTNDCCPLREAPPCFLQQGQSESCSDHDSASCVVEAADYTPKPPQRSLEEPQSHYACCFQRQEYDLWENPAHIQTSKHSHSRVRHTHSSSSSSSCRSSKLVRRRATHRECSELGRVVNGMVEVCTVSSSCSHSELSLGATDNQGEERPLSSSSHVLQALQDDVDDLPPSVSRCCHSNDPPQALPLTPQPPSPMSTSSRSRKHTPALQGEERGSKTSFRRSSNSCSCCRGEVTPKANEERVDSSLSKASQASHGSRAPSNRIRIPVAPEEGDDEAEQGGKRAVSVSGGSGGSIGSVGSIGSSVCSHCGGCDQGYDLVSCHSQKSHRSKRSQEEEEERSGRGLSGGSDECGFSQRTNKSNCTHFYQEGRAASMMSHMSLPEEGEDTGKEGEVEVGEKIEEGEKDERAANVLSAKCFSSVKGRTSRTSQKSKASESLADMEEQMEEPMEGEEKEGEVEDGSEQRAASIMSVKSNLSAKSSRSHTSTCSKADGSTKASERASSPRSEPDVAEDTGAAETEERGASVMSAKTNTSANYSRSHKSTKSPNAGAASASSETPDINAIETTGEGEEEEVGEKTEERLESSMSVRSNLSAKSCRSCKSTCSKAEQVLSAYSPEVPATEPEPTGEDEGEERATISTSVKSNLSAKSSRSHKSTCSRSIRVVSPKPAASETLVNDPADVVAAGALSAKTNASAKSRRSCKSTGDDEGEEREARAMSAKTRASIKFSRTHKSACKAASPKPAACETPVNDPEEKTEEEKTASALSAKTSASVRSSRSHKSTCSRSVRAETPVAKDIPAIETTEGDENGSAAAAGETEERPASAILDDNNASVKSSISHKSTCSKAERAPSSNSPEVPATEPEPTGDDEGEKRAAGATSKSSRSLKSTCSRNVWAETPGTKDIPVITTTGGEEMVDDTTAAGDTEERPSSAVSAKTSASVKSSRSHKSTCSRRAESQRSQPADVPVIETTGRDEVGEKKERAESVMSAKSNDSAMSRKSNRPTCNGSSRAVSPVAQDVPAIETTGGKEHRDKSTASVKTNRSHKSSSGRRAETPTAEQADVNETTGRDEKGEGTVRPASAMSTKYSASAKSSRSHKSTCNSGSARAISPAPKTADVPAIETTGVDREGEKTEERPASAMLAKSHISAKSSTSHTSNGSNRSTFLHLKKERGERGVRPAPSTTGNDLETGSVKSAKPPKNADSSTRPLSTASQANAKSTNQTPPATTETKEESQSHATSRPASTAAHRDDDVRDHVTEKKAPSVRSKSPAKAEGDSRVASFARSTRSKVKVQKASEAQDDEMPETRASLMQVKGHRVKAQSDTGSVHSVKTSKTDKIVIKGNSKPKSAQVGNTTSQSFNPPEGSRPAIQLGTASVSDSLLSQSLSAADLLRGNMAASRLSSPAGSKVSIPDSGKSGKSGSSQRRRKLKQEEVELEELGPLCLPKTSPIDIVSDWLRGIPADSGMDNPEDEMNEGIEETEVKREEGDEKGGETEGQGGEETEEKQEPIETTEMEQENTAETGKQEEEEEQEKTAETGQQEEEEEQENTAETGQQEEEEEQENTAETGQQEEEEEQENTAETGQQEEEEEEEQENTAETGQQEEEEEVEQENMAETGQQEEEEEEEQENTADTGQQEEEEEEEQENTAETGQQEEEEEVEQENMAETGQQEEEEEEEQENTAETGQEEEEQENTAETGQQEEEEEQENTAETGQQEEEEEQENMAETGQQDEEEQENTAETGQQEEEEEQENTAETGQQEEEEEQENTAETGQQEEEEEQENTAETGQQEEEEEQENTAETGKQDEEEQENMAETGQEEEEEEEEQENTAETGQEEEEEEQENMPETGQKKAARQPEEEGEVKEEEEERGEEEEEAAVGEKEKKDKEEEEVKKEEEGEVGAEEEGECSECADCCPDPAPPNNDISSPCHRHLFLSRESELPWSCHSSVAVMKVLLNPTLGRCSSLPEISPVYGRRLSSSAKGLLDCLAQLQLIDPPPSPAAAPGPDRYQRYQEVMDILESLWLSKPDLEKRKEGETEEKERLKDSGVDLSSGSAGSGGSGKTRPDETAGDITLIAKGEGGEGGGEGETDGRGGGGEGETDGGGEGEIDGGGEGEIDGGGEGEIDGETDGGGEGEIDGGGEGEIDGEGEGEIDGGGEGEVGEGEIDGEGEGETDGGGEGETDGGGEGETDGGGEGEIDGGGEGETDGGGEGETDGEGETYGGGEGETDGGGEGETYGGGEGETDGGGEGETDGEGETYGGGEGETDGGGEGETDGGGEGETYGGGEGETYGGGEEATSAELLSDAATPDIASQVQSSPGEDESSPESPPGTGEMLQTLERLKTPGSPSSSDSTAYKSPTDTETDTPEDTPSSGTPPSVQRPLLTKRVSQDPDPVWVLNLLKKLEKQFMAHYVDAMAELKVRWDLDNNVMLDTMITELRDEVKKRIQMSIDRELRKIRGRAGRGPRPPNMSRESTVTDQRRRRLKVMKVQSVNESDGEQGSGDVSDQRSEDEYCPCDACIRKKAEDKAIKMEAVVAKAPVMMAFDLRKILQMKKDPESPVPPSPTQGKNNDKLEEGEEEQVGNLEVVQEDEEEEEEEQVGNLEVVHEDEEEEERKEDIIPTVIEEDISEKEEEGVTGGEEGEEEGQESHGAESLMSEVEEEIAEEIGAEEQEEDGVVEGTEDEEEEAGEGETGCESAGEDGVEGAETGE